MMNQVSALHSPREVEGRSQVGQGDSQRRKRSNNKEKKKTQKGENQQCWKEAAR